MRLSLFNRYFKVHGHNSSSLGENIYCYFGTVPGCELKDKPNLVTNSIIANIILLNYEHFHMNTNTWSETDYYILGNILVNNGILICDHSLKEHVVYKLLR